MLKLLRDPIWQFIGVLIALAALFTMIALASPAFRELVQRCWLAALIATAAAMAFVVVVRFRRLIHRGLGWAGGQIKGAYLGMLSRLVIRPAKDYLHLMISPEGGDIQGEQLTDLRDRLSKLGPDALQVLEVIVSEYDPLSSGEVLIRPVTIALSPPANAFCDATTRAMLACDKLKTRGFVREAQGWIDKGGNKIRLRLDPSLSPGLILRMRELVVDELISRNIAPHNYRLLPVQATNLWRYDFYDNFADAKPIGHRGSDIDQHPEAICDGQKMRAIFEHPPDDAEKHTTLTYCITPPSDLSLIELTGLIGIEAHRPTPQGLQRSGRTPDNHVQFEIMINDQVQFKRRKESSQWEMFSILFVGRGDNLTVSFITNNLGQNAYNWAVWGKPELIELLRLE